ncbi:MAG TPA: DUF4198 domain-containing protein [Candidatus Binatia bacterium]
MKRIAGLTLFAWCLIAAPAGAHEFIIKPNALRVKTGDKVPLSVFSTHVFVAGEEMLPASSVKATLVEGGKSSALALRENNILETLDGTAAFARKGTAIIAGHLEEPVETVNSPTGKPQRARFEKFAKTLVVVDAADRSYEKVLGHRLEIVPLSDPTAARVGDEVGFKILFDGKPLQAVVLATYDGFSRLYNTYAYATEARDGGVARVKITHPGIWIVRVEKRVEVAEKDYNLHVMKAVLLFPVE